MNARTSCLSKKEWITTSCKWKRTWMIIYFYIIQNNNFSSFAFLCVLHSASIFANILSFDKHNITRNHQILYILNVRSIFQQSSPPPLHPPRIDGDRIGQTYRMDRSYHSWKWYIRFNQTFFWAIDEPHHAIAFYEIFTDCISWLSAHGSHTIWPHK